MALAWYGGIDQAAVAIGVCPGTLYRAARGVNVSGATRAKIENVFGLSLSELRQPFRDRAVQYA